LIFYFTRSFSFYNIQNLAHTLGSESYSEDEANAATQTCLRPSNQKLDSFVPLHDGALFGATMGNEL
jgi:hypothetical protein